jgi:cation:H+ antiporter
MLIDLLFISAGIILLYAGGELLIRGALSAARKLKISPLLSGIVLVGFGTSAPELVVSLDAVLQGMPDIATGNVVGSNIGNILLILGICAIICPMNVTPLVLRRDAFAVLGATLLFMAAASAGSIATGTGIIMILVLFLYLGWTWYSESKLGHPSGELHLAESEAVPAADRPVWMLVVMIISGLVLLSGGARVLIAGAASLAVDLGISEAVVGLTVVALGTSLPELTVSLISALRGKADVAIGNILGSNMFNITGILGISALTQPLLMNPRLIAYDQFAMLASVLILIAFLFTGRRLSRGEGVVLLILYAAWLFAAPPG